jgi:hypothetical protein
MVGVAAVTWNATGSLLNPAPKPFGGTHLFRMNVIV